CGFDRLSRGFSKRERESASFLLQGADLNDIAGQSLRKSTTRNDCRRCSFRVIDIKFRTALALKVDVNQHRATLRIGDISLRDRVTTTLRAIDLSKRKRRRVRQFELVNSVVDLVFKLFARLYLKVKHSNVRLINRGIEHFRHHTVRKGEPNLRLERRRSSKP